MTIGENIKKFRKERKLTQEQLGTILGVEKRSLFRSIIDHIVYDLKTKEYEIKFL